MSRVNCHMSNVRSLPLSLLVFFYGTNHIELAPSFHHFAVGAYFFDRRSHFHNDTFKNTVIHSYHLSLESLNNSSAIQVVWTHLKNHAIPRQETNIIDPHPPRNVREHFVPVLQSNSKRRARKRFDHFSFDANDFFIFVQTHSGPSASRNAEIKKSPHRDTKRTQRNGSFSCRRKKHASEGGRLSGKSILVPAFFRVVPNLSGVPQFEFSENSKHSRQ